MIRFVFRLFVCSFVALLCLTFDSTAVAQTETKAAEPKQEEMSPESLKQKYSYMMGYNMLQDLKMREIEFDIDELVKGLTDAAASKKPTMTDEEIQSVQFAFQRMLVRQQQERIAKLADENMRKGKEFLKANLLKEGVKEMENGLQYQVIKEGEGDGPRMTDSVKVHMKGMFIDGTVFQTTEGGEPIAQTVGGGIRGISYALQKMKPGDKWKLFVPSELAFGEAGDPPYMGPNEVVLFEIELIEIIK